MKLRIFTFTFLILLCGLAASAQTTEFNYQGSLKDGANAANGNYDFEFRLYDAVSGGTQVGSTLSRANVAVAAGIFAVKLDFASAFSGADRYLDITVRPVGTATFTALTPRQRVNSSPYAIKSGAADNASQLGGVAASQFVQTNDGRLSDARPPTAGSDNYIQNFTGTQQSASFNISGSGYTNGPLSGVVVDARAQLNLGGQKILGSSGPTNLIFGIGAGPTSTGTNNTFVGVGAAQSNSTGSSNTFVGSGVGTANSTGSSNTFVGSGVGVNNTASSNTFVGTGVGAANTSGGNNSFFGFNAGLRNTGAGQNGTFLGSQAGLNNTTGSGNVFVGTRSGQLNTTSDSNSFFGAGTGNFSTGAENTFLGNAGGPNNTLGNRNTFVGTGSGQGNTSGSDNTSLGTNVSFGSGGLNFATAIGSGSTATQSNSIYLGHADGSDAVRIPGAVLIEGSLIVDTLGTTTGNVHLCRNTANRISLCTTNAPDSNETGALRTLVSDQQKQIDTQAAQIKSLTKLVCFANKDADLCKEK